MIGLPEGEEGGNSLNHLRPEGWSDLMVALQGLLHTKPMCDVQDMLPLFQELVALQKKDADISITGVSKTELIQADIDKTEFRLFQQKFVADMQAMGVYQRKTRTRASMAG